MVVGGRADKLRADKLTGDMSVAMRHSKEGWRQKEGKWAKYLVVGKGCGRVHRILLKNLR